MKSPKIYATINRGGTTVRVKDNCKHLMAFISDRDAYMLTQPPIDDDKEPVYFVKKDVFNRIAGELKMGFKECFTKISFARSNGSFVIAREDMRREVMDAMELAADAKISREKKQKEFKEAAEAEKALQEKRQAELKESLSELPEEVFETVNTAGPQKAIETHGHMLKDHQIELLKQMAKLKYPKNVMTVEKRIGKVKQKGEYGGKCYRSACASDMPATWYNHSTREHYCESCAKLLNTDEHNQRDAQRLFGHELCTEVKE